jgi:hypothetical protein
MTQQTDTIDRLEKLVAAEHWPEADRATLNEMINTYRGVQQWGRFSRLIIVTLGGIAAFIASWDTAIGRIAEWFK